MNRLTSILGVVCSLVFLVLIQTHTVTAGARNAEYDLRVRFSDNQTFSDHVRFNENWTSSFRAQREPTPSSSVEEWNNEYLASVTISGTTADSLAEAESQEILAHQGTQSGAPNTDCTGATVELTAIGVNVVAGQTPPHFQHILANQFALDHGLRNQLVPANPVKVGDTWVVPAAALEGLFSYAYCFAPVTGAYTDASARLLRVRNDKAYIRIASSQNIYPNGFTAEAGDGYTSTRWEEVAFRIDIEFDLQNGFDNRFAFEWTANCREEWHNPAMAEFGSDNASGTFEKRRTLSQ